MKYILFLLTITFLSFSSLCLAQKITVDNIVIQQTIDKTKTVMNEENVKIDVQYYDVFFDVETNKEQYVDKNGKGYFPIEIKNTEQTVEQIKEECVNWVNRNNILSIYQPTYKSKNKLKIDKKKKEILERQAIQELKKEGSINKEGN